MARPPKTGVDYFPLNVDIDQDDKLVMIEAVYGIEGFGIVIKLIMKIYKEGYYYKWAECEQLLFSKRNNVDIKRVNAIINDCLKWDIFNEKLFNEYQILTSKGIQVRYLEIAKRRTSIELFSEFILVNRVLLNEYNNLIIVSINEVIANINEVNSNISTQSKVNKSKEDIPLKKESKVFTNDDYEYKLANFLSKSIAERLDKPLKDEKTLQSWANEFNKMVRLDKLDIDEMKEVLIFSQDHVFWKKNILSASKFRKQYITLLAQMKG